MNLVVVESPAKAKTIKKYLGQDFEVLASYGHVRDLVPKEGAVDPEHGFSMQYQAIERNDRHVQAISRKLKEAQTLYLATDPDREGEAISWHLYELLQHRGLLKDKSVHRIAFHEITQRAVQEAVAHPRALSIDLINAQQARRALDYLVGFNLSPLLWKKVRRGLSAGRVQSPALRLIVEREMEIEAFVAREYWTIEADVAKGRAFTAMLSQFEGARVEQFTITDTVRAHAVTATLLAAASGGLRVEQVERKQRKRQPAPPFTTSTLQQEAARKLGFTAQRTMRTAQQLYEGVEIGGDATGLISYMRTDSVHLAEEALAEIRAFILQRYGAAQVPDAPRHYKTKAKNAQEAHEAIRPTSVLRVPTELAAYLNRDQLRLYELIWKRTVACQMQHATINTVAVELSGGPGHLFRATGSTVADPGFMQVYLEGRDDAVGSDEDETLLPPLEPGDQVALKALRPEQHFTEPPARYGEATLVRALEEHGIGRPSTYASIISTLQDREYVRLDKKRFFPSDVGRVVNRFLTEHFTQYVDYDFTARLEDDLDAVSRGEAEWVPLLEQFWQPFKAKVAYTETHVTRSDVTQEALEELCPKCGGKLSIRLGRRGRFIGCTCYPKCDYTRDLEGNDSSEVAQEVEGRHCPKCDAPLVVKAGRYGKFIGCSAYPKCTHIEPIDKPQDTGVICPACHQGTLLKRKSRRGKVFYSCATYPTCDYSVWDQPLAEPCPQCSWPILTLKITRSKAAERVCPRKECGFKEPYAPELIDDSSAE
jgi:DNA topoisomerase I